MTIFSVPTAVLTGSPRRVRMEKTTKLPPLISEPMKPPKKVSPAMPATTNEFMGGLQWGFK